MSGSTEGFGGSAGGVEASIPLAAGRFGQQQGNGLANNPLAFIDAMTHMQQFRQQQQLFPGQLELQQQGIQQGGLGIQKSQAELNALRNNQVATGMMPLFQKGDALTLADATNTLGQLHAAGYNTDALTAMIAKSGQTGGRGLADVIRSAVTQAHPALGVPNMQATNVGGEVVMQDVNPFTNPAIATTRLPVTMTPAEKTQTQPTVIQTGEGPQKADIPKGAIYTPTGDFKGNPLLEGPLAGQPLTGHAPVIPTEAPAGVAAAAGTTAIGNANQALALQTSAANLPMQKAILGNLESTLSKFTAGPVSDWMNVAASFTNKINPFFNTFDPSRIASQDEFRKQALTLAQEQFKALHGTGTDAQLSSTTHTSPNDFLSNQSNVGIIHFLKGNVDALQVMNSEWQKWLAEHNNNAGTYGQFVTQFNKTFDPRVFQSVYAGPPGSPERQLVLKGMSKEEQVKFRADYNAAVDKGWIPDAGG
jgi:hypothetical protein